MQPIEPKRSTTIKYINPKLQSVTLPEYSGRSDETLVPDTIDIEGMARLAINGLTEPTDPDADYEIYWRLLFNTNPPVMWHGESDIVYAKFIEALPLLRLVSGSSQNMHVEKRWMETILQMQGPDGLIYIPKKGRPWCKFAAYGKEPPGDHYFAPWFEGRILGAMTIYYLLSNDPVWKNAGQRLVDALNKLAVHDGNEAHFSSHEFGTQGRFTPLENPADAVHNPATYYAWCMQGLSNYGKHTGYASALELAGKLFRWIKNKSNHFDKTGRFLEEYPGVERVHFHGHTMVLLAVLDYGLAAKDSEAIDFARKGFEYGMTQGECRLGFFSEWLNLPEAKTLEICELADMTAIAVKLSQSGNGDYWDMVDRWTRNLFYESQLKDSEWVYWLSEKTPTPELGSCQLPPYHTAERAVERNIGAFAGWMTPNDFVATDWPYETGFKTPGIMHCCTGNGTRTIYYIWENMITHSDNMLKVNLLMNRVSKWADIRSHIPYTGQVDMTIKKPLDVSVRIPEWTSQKEVVCKVNEKEKTISFDGHYAQIGSVQKSDVIKLNFPIDEKRELINVHSRGYRILLRGNTCVLIDPPGKNRPLFQRGHLRTNTTRWKKAKEFVPDKILDW